MTSKTFKQFLEDYHDDDEDDKEDPLADLALQLFFKKEMGLTDDETGEAILWIRDEKDPGDLKYDTWDQILDWMNQRDSELFNYPAYQILNTTRHTTERVMYHDYGIEL